MENKLGKITSYLLPRLQDLFFLGIFFFVCTQGFRLLNGDGDLGRHITIGTYILDHWVIPTHDIFSHTMTGVYLVPHEWLTEVLFGLATRLMGLSGDVVLSGVVIATAFVIVYKQTIDKGIDHLVALFIVTWAALASFLHWLARPHIFTFLFVAIWTFNLERAIRNRKIQIWLLPLIMLLWANAHGAFIFGIVILGAYIAGWGWEYWQGHADKETGIFLATTGLLSFIVTFLNPTGWHLWVTSVGYIGNKFLVDNTIEYLSPNFHNPNTWPFLVMLISSMLLLGIGKKLRMHEILLLSGWSALSLFSARNIPLYAIITAPYFGVLVQPTISQFNKLHQINNVLSNMETQLRGILFPVLAILTVIFMFTLGIRVDPAQKGNLYDSSRFPVDAVNWLEQNPQKGYMFNEFTWGGYILFRLWPEQKVFIDGQTDFYGAALVKDYLTMLNARDDWEGLLEKYQIDWVLLPGEVPLARILKANPQWRILYEDSISVILKK